jgi:hypothetical protein
MEGLLHRERQQKIIRECVDHPDWLSVNEDDRIRFVTDALQFFMPTFKNGDFREEQERRLIFTPYATALPKPKFRTRRGLLVPYFSLREVPEPSGGGPGFKLPIKGLLIGPSQHRAPERGKRKNSLRIIFHHRPSYHRAQLATQSMHPVPESGNKVRWSY